MIYDQSCPLFIQFSAVFNFVPYCELQSICITAYDIGVQSVPKSLEEQMITDHLILRVRMSQDILTTIYRKLI